MNVILKIYAQAAELRCKRTDAQLTCSEFSFSCHAPLQKSTEAKMNEWAGQTSAWLGPWLDSSVG